MNIFKYFETDSFHNLMRLVGCVVIIYLGIITSVRLNRVNFQ